ncbi:hypothetical protein BU17DRAFT_69861 [Hysterangium stoloniferum]|nr:hypothetical protein BU17DRAFT_69861 [Hysterangium stoloniferum]
MTMIIMNPFMKDPTLSMMIPKDLSVLCYLAQPRFVKLSSRLVTPSIQSWFVCQLNYTATIKYCNIEVNLTCMLQGDSVHNVAELLIPLLNKGVRLLYAGKAESGNEAWVHNLDGHPFAEAFKKTQTSKWVTLSSGKEAGDVHSVGTNYTFVVVNEVGHMVPFDQSEAAADLIVRWINSIPLTWANSTVV